MEKLYLDLAIALFFLVALVMILSTRTQISRVSTTSFQMLSTGLSLLALMSIATAVQSQLAAQGILGTTIVASGELFRLILLIAGLMFTASGISRWLPISRNAQVGNSANAEFVVISNLKSRLNQLISEQCTFDEFLRLSLIHFSEMIGISLGTVYSVSKKKNRAQLIASNGGFENVTNVAREFLVNPIWLEKLDYRSLTSTSVSFAEVHPSARGTCYCFPVQVTSDRIFLYLIWTAAQSVTEIIDKNTLRSVAEAIKTRVQLQHLSTIQEFRNKCDKIAASMRDKLAACRTLNEMVRIAKTELQSYLPVDFISINSMHQNGICRRTTIGLSDTVLNEIDTKLGPDNSYLHRVSDFNQVMTFVDIGNNETAEFPKLITKMGIRNLIALPLYGAGNCKGIMTIGTSNVKSWSRAQTEVIKTSAPAFEIILSELNLMEHAALLVEREKLLREFVSDTTHCDSNETFYGTIAATINRATDCPIVRVSTIDTDGQFLNSQALINDSSMELKSPENGHLILPLLQYHNTAKENGNTVSVKCRNKNEGMSELEVGQVFSKGIKRAVVVPIKSREKVLGLISLADDGKNVISTLTDKNIEFVETVAAMAGMAMDAQTRQKEILSRYATAAREDIFDSGKSRGLRTQLRSSLTSIIGSLEMIRSQKTGDDGQKDRFFNIIDRSARKLNEYLTE